MYLGDEDFESMADELKAVVHDGRAFSGLLGPLAVIRIRRLRSGRRRSFARRRGVMRRRLLSGDQLDELVSYLLQDGVERAPEFASFSASLICGR
jgi:hypothetical protein